MVHAACWAHARRYFVDAVKLNKQDAASVRIVALMDELFAIDARARDENIDDATRHTLRLQKAPLLLDKSRRTTKYTVDGGWGGRIGYFSLLAT